MQQVLIHQNLRKNLIQLALKSNVDKLDIDKLKTIPDDISNLKSKIDKLDIGKLETIPVGLVN